MSFEPEELLRRLNAAGVDYVVVGGFAVIAHGVIRATDDLDIVPGPDRDNLERLANLLSELEARPLGVDAELLERSPSDPHVLAEGGSFQLETALGRLDVLQRLPWLPDHDELAERALRVELRGTEIPVCSLEHLKAMKRAAGGPRDLEDLRDLERAEDEAPDSGP